MLVLSVNKTLQFVVPTTEVASGELNYQDELLVINIIISIIITKLQRKT
jgi:hypothetical protein